MTLLPSDQKQQVHHRTAQSLLFTPQKIAVPPCSQRQRRRLHILPACITLLWLSRIFLHFPGIYQFRVPESSESGTPVGRIRAADKDVGENAEMYFTIVSGDGLDTFDIFTDKATQEGVITVSKVRLQTPGTLITIIGNFSVSAPLFIPLRENYFHAIKTRNVKRTFRYLMSTFILLTDSSHLTEQFNQERMISKTFCKGKKPSCFWWELNQDTEEHFHLQ